VKAKEELKWVDRIDRIFRTDRTEDKVDFRFEISNLLILSVLKILPSCPPTLIFI
jgi:hypothetical protein